MKFKEAVFGGNNGRIRMKSKLSPMGKKAIVGITFILFIIITYIISTESYNLFQYAIELVTIVIGFSIYIMAKNTHKVSQNNYFLFLGTTFFIVSAFDILHLLTIMNKSIFTFNADDVSLQLRAAARCFQAISLVVFSILISREEKPIKIDRLINIYFITAAVFFIEIVYGNLVFNYNYYSIGNLPLKYISEGIICIFFLIALILIIKNKKKMHSDIILYLLLAVSFLLFSEFCFTFSKGSYDILYISEHIAKLISYYLIYKAIIQTTLENPYNILFYKLTETNSSLEIKTRLLMQINKKLNDEINERKSIEEKLRESKRKYQALLDYLPFAVLTNTEGKIAYVNNATLSLLKAKKYKDLLGKDISDIIHPEFRDLSIQSIEEGYENESKEMHEFKFIAMDNTVIDVEIKAVPHIFNDKVSSLIVIRDISERKEALKKEEALKEAKEYDRIKNEFMANISHELRTPLNVIFSSAQIIELYSQNNNNNENCKNILKYSKSLKQNCNRMLRLVNNLIDLTKIDSGFLKLNMQNHNIVNIVEDITLSVAEYIENKNINLIFDTDIEEKYMAFDVDMIERIILNLLSNAVKFTPPGGNIKVCISNADKFITISVKDSGIGIPEDKLEMIFDRFRQVDKSLTRNTEGSGIGLNLVKSLIVLHGGEIKAYSTEGVGSEFIIKLPVTLTAEDEVAAAIDIREEKVERIHIEFSDIYN